MVARSRTDLILSLPEDLTPEQLRYDVRPFLSLSNSNKSRHFGFSFSPPTHFTRIVVDCDKVQRGTATGVCELMSLLDWLKVNGSLPITLKRAPRLSHVGLDQQLKPLTTSLTAFPLIPKRIDIPHFHPATSDVGWEHRNRLMKIARRLANNVASTLPEVGDSLFHKTALEFLQEGLLNAYEHGFALSESGGRVWVAASLRPAENPADSCWNWWHGQCASGATSVLELAIADSGAGVPEMLGDAFRKNEHTTEFHDTILEFALSPFGTRKSHEDHASETLRQGYRGLYRILHHTQALSGQTLLRSGLGLYGYGFAESDSFAIRATDLRATGPRRVAYNPTSALPGTTLSMCVALPLPLRAHPPRQASGTRTVEYDASHITAHPMLWQQSSRTVDDYVRQFNLGIKEDFVSRETAGTFKEPTGQGPRLTALIHPGPRLICTPGTDERERWNAMVIMMAENTHPNFIPVHFFFDVPQDDLRLAQETFWSVCTQKSFDMPVICGLQSPRDGHLYWFIFIPDQERASLRLSLTREFQGEKADDWGRMLEATYRNVVSVDRTASGFRLRLNLPDRVTAAFQSEVLGTMVRRLAETPTRSAPWYWEAGKDEKTLVKTRSGKIVKHYVTAFALCLNEPIVEMTMITMLEAHIDEMRAGKDGRVIMVPDDTSESSYILAKRLRSRLNARQRVEVIHVDQLNHSTKPNDIILAFTDAIHTSERIRNRLEKQSQEGLETHSVFACLDLRKPEAAWPAELPTLISVIRWPLLPPLKSDETETAGYTMVTIDALTHEMLPAGGDYGKKSSHVYYRDFAWRNPCVPFPKPDLLTRLQVAPEQIGYRIDLLPYGLQHVDERLNVARFQDDHALNDPVFREQVARWLAAVIGSIAPAQEHDVVLFCRDECGVFRSRRSLAERALELLEEIGQPLKSILWLAPLAATRKGARPILSHHPATRTLEAEAVALPKGDQTELALRQRQVADNYVALFVDSACASGRTIRDFLLPMVDIELQPRPSKLVVCPLVSRLPAMEEKILLRTRRLSTGWGDLHPDETSEQPEVSLHFAALLQLRTPVYANADLVPGLLRIKDLLVRIDETWHSDMRRWKSGVQGNLDSLVERITQVESYPLYVDLYDDAPERETRVTEDTLLIRQLLSLHQEGIAVISPLVSLLRKCTIVEKDHSLLVVLALEPDLLKDDILRGSFRDDIANLAMSALDLPASRRSSPLHSCALWVLRLLEEPFENQQDRIAKRCVLNEHLRGQWLSLIQTYPKGRGALSKTAKDAVTDLYMAHEGSQDDVRRMLSRCGNLLALWNEGISGRMPQDYQQAQHCIRTFLREARTRHDEVGFPVWNRFTRAFNQLPSVASPLPAFTSTDWRKAQDFLESSIIQALEAIHILSGPSRREEPHAAMSAARDAFHYARIATTDAARVAEWGKVLSNTMNRSVEWLFASNRGKIIGDNEATEQGGIIDRMLPEVVQEPVGLLLHTLTSELGERFQLELDLDPRLKRSNRLRLVSSSVAVSVGMLIREIWMEADRLPLVWDKQINLLRRVFRLMAGNISNHGDHNFPCSITVRLLELGEGQKVSLTLKNLAKEPSVPGNGAGHSQINRLVDAAGGSFTQEINENLFVCHLVLPVEFISLEERT
ncbi:hypothetical protein [Roseomonas genomospecies 6]|uniref:Uncharacterized protein n=1 Tax=Roseomonas genomospecies 6 TaxID=214106 RepID=A0A9W7TZB6_9PROT|nr:hypothetical protein [Roseomonas genomospecies 6]KAA0680918.1 hypothetical protein DS843_10920 [Roseomonas genomospecies 6]